MHRISLMLAILVCVATGIGIKIGIVRLSPNGFTKTMKIKIGFKAKGPVSSFDPARIQMATEAVVLDNLYSPLVRFDNEGRIEPALAEKFHWHGRDLLFSIREGARTVDGKIVTAEDAAFSLKRLLVDRGNAHGDLQTFLCPEVRLTSVDQACEGIQIEEQGRVLKLTVAREEYRSFLLQMLANMDFGIIPRSSCDSSRPVPRIIDFRNTSGPYYLESDHGGGAFVLRSNPNHWLAATGIPEFLEFRPAPSEVALTLLEAGEIDFIPTINTAPSYELQAARASGKYEIFETLPIQKLLISTTRDKLERFTDLERHAIHQLIRKRFFQLFPNLGWKPSLEFFPAFGEGGLDSAQRELLHVRLTESESIHVHKPFTLGVYPRALPLFEKALGGLAQVKLVVINQPAPFMKPAERPDFYIGSTDSGFYESINLISYAIFDESFDLTPDEGRVWLSKYMLEPEKAARLALLRDLHFRSLMRGLTGVIGESPYVAVGRKGCRYEGSRFFAGSPLWQIRCD